MRAAVLSSSRSRYVLGDFLAEGGMGAIYLGRREAPTSGPPSGIRRLEAASGMVTPSGIGARGVGEPGEEVVLKALLPELVEERHLVELFLREARLTARLDHPNIVRTLDLVAGEGTYFIVMEYVRGADLRTVSRRARRRGRALAPEAALFAGLGTLDALAYAHGRTTEGGAPLGLIHRDVSPSNILVAGDGGVKLTDFGIAKLATHRSVFYKVKGKVGYMSPEQAHGEPLDARSDLFSLAVCVWEGLTGERLFPAAPSATAPELYARPAPPPSSRNAVLAPLDAVMAKALAFGREARFQSAEALREALAHAARQGGLLFTRDEMAAHLADVAGADARAWHDAPPPPRAPRLGMLHRSIARAATGDTTAPGTSPPSDEPAAPHDASPTGARGGDDEPRGGYEDAGAYVLSLSRDDDPQGEDGEDGEDDAPAAVAASDAIEPPLAVGRRPVPERWRSGVSLTSLVAGSLEADLDEGDDLVARLLPPRPPLAPSGDTPSPFDEPTIDSSFRPDARRPALQVASREPPGGDPTASHAREPSVLSLARAAPWREDETALLLAGEPPSGSAGATPFSDEPTVIGARPIASSNGSDDPTALRTPATPRPEPTALVPSPAPRPVASDETPAPGRHAPVPPTASPRARLSPLAIGLLVGLAIGLLVGLAIGLSIGGPPLGSPGAARPR